MSIRQLPSGAGVARRATMIRPQDLLIDTFRSGPANAPQISVRVTHRVSGITAQSDVFTSQLSAREQAIERLTALLKESGDE